eukprot:m.95964 g.95964  ORF g.95964 m.95964 type:complete len:343 (-) comp15472_c3_seq4:250-1278(-)
MPLWLIQVLGLAVLMVVLQVAEKRAAMRGCNRAPMPSWLDRTIRAIFLLQLAPSLHTLDGFVGFPLFLPALLIYMIPYLDLAEQNGGRKTLYARRWRIWNFFIRRLNLKMEKTCDLPSNKSYIFGVHPHAVLPFGSMIALANESTASFSEMFPGVQFRTLAATFCFYVPIYRDILLWGGVVDAARYSAHRVLNMGYSLALVPGGATEALYCSPREDVVYLRKRRGFVRLALETGASLVPVFSFNECNTYELMGLDNPLVDKFKKKFQSIFGISLPLIKNILPRPTSVTVLVGAPIAVPKIPEPSNEEVEKYLNIYIAALEKLYNENSAKYSDPPNKPPLKVL